MGCWLDVDRGGSTYVWVLFFCFDEAVVGHRGSDAVDPPVELVSDAEVGMV